jgi:acyl CoA:acetate/3-ketoacid CoA transferase alpha subunit/acyl CoA:acetate/3-ketoacid CoA transferase beta subunit
MGTSKVMPLDEAIHRWVEPGMHLHFSSAPSRANAAIRAVCRRFRGTDPRFTLSSTGFHSTAHLLGRLRLGARYISCFFGDNFPTPRANLLYGRLLNEGVDLEHWSLLSYVTALRAGALGHPYGVTRSILGSSMEDDLVKRRRFAVTNDPLDPTRRLGLVVAMRPDLTFVHVPAADTRGRAVAPLPLGEGPWGALAAARGVIITAERIVTEDVTARAPEAIVLPPHRVLAVCAAPFGAHPQPLFAPRGLDLPSYGDDFDAYELLREVGLDDQVHTGLVDDVLLGGDDVYARYFDLAVRAPFLAPVPASPPAQSERPPSQADQMAILAARRIAKIVRAGGHRAILAGVGRAFFAARLAKLLLERGGVDVDVHVETGMYGIECGPASGSFLLGFNVITNARRLTSIEDVLGAVACGADNRCVGVIGAAEVDARGNLNSTLLADGSLLVGSGGANDIASAADDVVVLTSCDRHRLVRDVPYITSPGWNVRYVVTEQGVLCRDTNEAVWRIEDVLDAAPARRASTSVSATATAPSLNTVDATVSPPSSDRWPELRGARSKRRIWATPAGDTPDARIRRICPWPLSPVAASRASPLTPEERVLLNSLK